MVWRYENDQCTAEEKAFVEEWYQSLDQFAPGLVSEEQRMIMKEAGLLASRQWTSADVPVAKVAPVRKWWIAVAAAAIVIILLVVVIWVPQKNTEGSLTRLENSLASVKILSLEDGTVVRLDSGAVLEYRAFAHQPIRKVVLKGSAFFEVAHDSTRPFWVYSENLVTRVLGTSFKINSTAGQSSVAVRSGKVAVYKARGQEDVTDDTAIAVLTPNQQVLFNKQLRAAQPSIVSHPEVLTTQDRNGPLNMVFNESPFSEVIDRLSKMYGIEIEVEKSAVLSCPFTGDISDNKISLFDKLGLVCQTINAQFELKETHVYIKGKGCLR